MKRRLSILLFLSGALGWAVPPDQSFQYRFTNRTGELTDGITVYNGATRTIPINNSNLGCIGWQLNYNSEGFSVVSINLQTNTKTWLGGLSFGPGNTWSTFGGTASLGSLPITSTSQGNYVGYGYYPYVAVNLATATGTGSIDVVLSCWKSINYAGVNGGGSSTNVTATSLVSATVLTDTSGSSTAYAGSATNCPGSLVTWQVYSFVPNQTNSTTTPTLNPCGFGALTITHMGGTALLTSELDASGATICIGEYNGTNFLLFDGSCQVGPGFVTLTKIPAASVPNAPTNSYSWFNDSSNSNHLTTKDSSGITVDIQGSASGSWSHNYWITNTKDGATNPVQAGSLVWCVITNGCTLQTSADFQADPTVYNSIQFPSGSDTQAYLQDFIPHNWDLGAVTLTIIETPTVGSGTIQFNAQSRCFGDNTTVYSNTSPAYNTAGTSTKTVSSSGNAYVHLITVPMTGCTADNWLQIIITRKGTVDTSTGFARVYQIGISAL